MRGRPEIETLASFALAGGWAALPHLLHSRDLTEQLALVATAERVARHRQEEADVRRRNLAREVGNEVGRHVGRAITELGRALARG